MIAALLLISATALPQHRRLDGDNGASCCVDGALCMDPMYWSVRNDPTSTASMGDVPWATSAAGDCAAHQSGGAECSAEHGESCCKASCGDCSPGAAEIEEVPEVLDECYTLPNGADYRGTVNHTVDGSECLRWDQAGNISICADSSCATTTAFTYSQLLAHSPCRGEKSSSSRPRS